mgnify:FL=1
MSAVDVELNLETGTSMLNSIDHSLNYCGLQAEFVDQLSHLVEVAGDMDSIYKCDVIINLLSTMTNTQRMLRVYEESVVNEEHV